MIAMKSRDWGFLALVVAGCIEAKPLSDRLLRGMFRDNEVLFDLTRRVLERQDPSDVRWVLITPTEVSIQSQSDGALTSYYLDHFGEWVQAQDGDLYGDEAARVDLGKSVLKCTAKEAAAILAFVQELDLRIDLETKRDDRNDSEAEITFHLGGAIPFNTRKEIIFSRSPGIQPIVRDTGDAQSTRGRRYAELGRRFWYIQIREQ